MTVRWSLEDFLLPSDCQLQTSIEKSQHKMVVEYLVLVQCN